MADLTLQSIANAGTVPAFVAAAGGGDRFPSQQGAYLHVKNGGGGSINVTLNSVQACSQGFDHDVIVAVAAGAEKLISLPDANRFSNAGWCDVTYSGVTTVTVGAFKAGS